MLAWRLSAVGTAAALLGVLSAAQPVASSRTAQPDAKLAASGPWLDRLNLWRASTGVPALVEDTTWSSGDYNHSRYMVKNDLVTHYETVGTPYYTAAGDQAAKSGNLHVNSTTSETDSQAIDWWMQAPFHAMGMMDPRLTTTGFGSYREVGSGWQFGATLDTLRGNPFTGGRWPVMFPGKGTTEPLTSYDGYESPNPLSACSGYTAPSGLPIFIMVGGNVATTVTAHSFTTAAGTALSHCVIDSRNASLGSSLTYRGGVILIPRSPLQNGVSYRVGLTVNGKAYSWSFTVGAFSICHLTSTPAPTSPAAPGTTVTFTATASGCPNPLYEFWVRAPGASLYTLAQAYSSTATFAWNTTGLASGAYAITVWVRDASSTGLAGNASGRWDEYNYQTYNLTAGCLTVTDTPSAPSPATVGASIVFTGAATGCPNPVYEFWVRAPSASLYTLAQAYSATATFSWSTAGKAPGAWAITVWVRDSASGGAYGNSSGRWDAYLYVAYVLVAPCPSVTDAPSPASPAQVGTSVVFTAQANGCASPLFEFWVKAPGQSLYTLAQAYGASATFTWNTSGKPAGVYAITVWVRDAASPGAFSNGSGSWDAYSYQTYSLT